MADYGPVAISRLKDVKASVQAALRRGDQVLLSRHGVVVASIEPPAEKHAALLLDFATKSGKDTPLPVLTMTDIGRGSPSAVVREAEAGVEALVTDRGRVLGVLTSAPVVEDRSHVLRRAEAIQNFMSVNPDATVSELAAFADELDSLLDSSSPGQRVEWTSTAGELNTKLSLGTDKATDEPVMLDLADERSLLLLASDPSTKTAAIQAIADETMRRFTSNELVIALMSSSKSWASLVPDDYLCGHARSGRQAMLLCTSIATELEHRARKVSTGPRMLIVVDDLGEKFEFGRFLAPLLPFFSKSNDLGVNFLIGSSMSDFVSPISSAVLSGVASTGALAVMLDNDWNRSATNLSARTRLEKWSSASGARFAHTHLPSFSVSNDFESMEFVRSRALELLASSKDSAALVTNLASLLPSAAGVLLATSGRDSVESMTGALSALEAAESAVRSTEASIREGIYA